MRVFLVSQAGRRAGFVLLSMPTVLCGVDTQPVRNLALAADLCVFLASQTGRRAGSVLLSMPTLWCRHTVCTYTCTLQLTCAFL
jgi:hypothetical protein